MLSLLKISDLFNIINKDNTKILNVIYVCKEWNEYFLNTTSLWCLLYKQHKNYNMHKVTNINAVTQKEYKWLIYDRLRIYKDYYCKRCNLFNPHHLTHKGYCSGKNAACMSKDSKIPCNESECSYKFLTKWTGRFDKYMCKSCRREKFDHYFIPKYQRENHSFTDSKYICPSLDNNFSWNYESSHDNSFDD